MDFEKNVKNYEKRLVAEGALKAVAVGLIVGFSANMIYAVTGWMLDIKNIWLGFVLFAVASAATALAVYFLKYRPHEKSVARRIDALGLQERIITMQELQKETTFIAQKQRDDALKALASVNAGLIRITVSVGLIIALAGSFLLSGGATTVLALSSAGIIKSGREIIKDSLGDEDGAEFEVVYEVEGEGEIDGEDFQIVEKGESAAPVVAVPADGWIFVGWDDGLESDYRQDTNITSDKVVVAMFEEVELDGMPIGTPGEDGPGAPGEGEGEGDGNDPNSHGGKGNGGKDGKSDGESDGESDQAGGESPGHGRGDYASNYQPNNQIIDGKTYYGGTTYEEYYGDAMDYISQNGEMPDELKEIISDYYDTIEQ